MAQPRSYEVSDVGNLFQDAIRTARDAIDSKSGGRLQEEAKEWIVAEREKTVKLIQAEFTKIHDMRNGEVVEGTANYLSDDPKLYIFIRIPTALITYAAAFLSGLESLVSLFGFRKTDVSRWGQEQICIVLYFYPCKPKIIGHLDFEDKYTEHARKRQRGDAAAPEDAELFEIVGNARRAIMPATKKSKKEEDEGDEKPEVNVGDPREEKPAVKVEEKEAEGAAVKKEEDEEEKPSEADFAILAGKAEEEEI